MAINAFALLQAAAATSNADMLLLNVDGVNQSFSSLLPLSADDTSDMSAELDFAASVPALGVERLPSLEQLLRNEWLHHNMSQMLNISMDNLTSLLINAQNTPLLLDRAQPRTPQTLLITLTTFYALIFVAGVLGNLITCFVISKCKFMHTATNFYLFNLAVSDLILLLSGMPQDLYNLWYPDSYPPMDVLCIMESVLSETAANATVLTITAFTVERYIAICHPFRQHTMSKLSRVVKFIFAIWVMALLLALPQAMQYSVVSQNGGTSCTMKNDFFAHVFAVSGFIFFGGPMTAICVLYVLIGVKLKRSHLLQAVPRRAYDVHRGITAQGRVIRMLVAVAVAFFLCWAPFHAQRLMAAYGSTAQIDSQIFNDIFEILDYTAGVLYFLSTCINPLLYNIMSHKFREAFKVTLARHFGFAGMYQVQNHTYSALLRQNGSMRHTTDSIRTTTTTINSANGGGGSSSCRSSHRNRCISAGSQPTLFPTLSKHDIFAANSTSTRTGGDQQRMLQKQISQLSSMGDANSLLKADTAVGQQAGTAYRLKELRHSLGSGHNGSLLRNAKSMDDRLSVNSQEWKESNMEMNRLSSENAAELFTKPVAPVAPIAPLKLQPVHAVAELTCGSEPTRSRVKLSRIVSHRDQDPFLVHTKPHVELVRVQYSTKERDAKGKSKTLPRKSRKTLDTLSEKFRWRTRRKQPVQRGDDSQRASSSGRARHDATSQSTTSASTSASTPTPSKTVMRIVRTTRGPGAATETTFVDTELSVRNGSFTYGTPKAL